MVEKNKFEGEFQKIRELLKKEDNGFYNKPFIMRRLKERENMRKVFLAVIKNSPARISEIFESALLTKPTCYSQLHNLMDLNLLDRIYVLHIMNGTVKNAEIKKKFEEWTKNMPDGLKRYYLAKTSYWVVTDFGKQFVTIAFNFSQEFKEKGDKKDGK